MHYDQRNVLKVQEETNGARQRQCSEICNGSTRDQNDVNDSYQWPAGAASNPFRRTRPVNPIVASGPRGCLNTVAAVARLGNIPGSIAMDDDISSPKGKGVPIVLGGIVPIAPNWFGSAGTGGTI